MFQSLRPNSQIYVFYKGDTPRLEKGYVISQPISRPKYQVPATFGQPEMVVDVTATVNGQTVNYTNLPAQSDIADSVTNGESIVVSDNKDAMNAEILSLKQKSIDIINSVDYHKDIVNNYNNILEDLNPEYAEKQKQQLEIDTLKSQMTEMSKSITELMRSNDILINRLTKSKNYENVGN